jgi:spore coat polysaccharide biosynthesis protein SpsF
MIASLKTYVEVDQIVLAISEGTENEIFKVVAERLNVKFVVGSPDDVLDRLIQACKFAGGTDIFRLTSESPFTYYEAIGEAWRLHLENSNDLTSLDFLPDGSGFEIINLPAYEKSWLEGGVKHRSEYCSLFIRENKDRFKHELVGIPDSLRRTDLRFTVDYPEDLVLCRAIYEEFKSQSPRIPLASIIKFVDDNPNLKALVNKFVANGLKTMYL